MNQNKRRVHQMTRGKLTILLSLFALLSFFSVLTLYSTHQLSTEREIVTPLYTYEEVGTYDYTARLKPNTIYDNRTTLKPGQGVLYRQITESIDTLFTYTFQGDRPANITITYSIDVSLPNWRKSIYTIPVKTRNYTGTTAQFSTNFNFNIDSIEALKQTLEAETRAGVSDYNVTIRPQILTTAKTEVDTQTLNVNLTSFTPTLAYTFRYDSISTSSLEYTRPGARTYTETIYLAWVMNQRYASYGFSAASFAGLAITSWAFTKTRPRALKPAKPIEEIISPFQEVIAESAGEPTYKGQTATITMKSLEDLIKVADWLGKPVLSYQKPKSSKSAEFTRVFYVLDGITRYECTITAPSITKEEEEEKEAEIEEVNSD